MSPRAIQTLQQVDVILCEDSRLARNLCNHFQIKKELRSCHGFNEQETVQRNITEIQQGRSLALITDAGTPAISDPGYRIVSACHKHGLRITPIPGPSAATTALSASGMSADQYLFMGFLPRKGAERRATIEIIARAETLVVLYESPKRIIATLADLANLLNPKRRIAIGRELTKKFEEISVRTVTEWNSTPPREQGEFVLVIAGAGADSRFQQQQKRFDDLKKHTSLQDDEILQVMAIDFQTSIKRLRYRFLPMDK